MQVQNLSDSETWSLEDLPSCVSQTHPGLRGLAFCIAAVCMVCPLSPVPILMGLLCPKGLFAGCLGPGHQLGCTGLGAGRVCGEWQGNQESPSDGLWEEKATLLFPPHLALGHTNPCSLYSTLPP